MENSNTVPYLKMNGLCNDFIIVDARFQNVFLTPALVRSWANRQTGIGCDQLVCLKTSRKADVYLEIYNADGSQAGACGNASRCVGKLVMDETGRNTCALETASGNLNVTRKGNQIRVEMGRATIDGNEVPPEHPLVLSFAFVDVGNPHLVCHVAETSDELVQTLGPQWVKDPLFPHGVNVGFVQVISPNQVRLKVWERGVGQTRACGTGACAAAVALYYKGLIEEHVTVDMDGGSLDIQVTPDLCVTMVGSATLDGRGELDIE